MPRLGDDPYFHVPFTLQPFLLMGSRRGDSRGEPCPRAEGDDPGSQHSAWRLSLPCHRGTVPGPPIPSTLGHRDFDSVQIREINIRNLDLPLKAPHF